MIKHIRPTMSSTTSVSLRPPRRKSARPARVCFTGPDQLEAASRAATTLAGGMATHDEVTQFLLHVLALAPGAQCVVTSGAGDELGHPTDCGPAAGILLVSDGWRGYVLAQTARGILTLVVGPDGRLREARIPQSAPRLNESPEPHQG